MKPRENSTKVISLEEMPEMAEVILTFATKHQFNLIALIGDLGAGKTTLTQELAKALGIKETIQSPTFVLMSEYECNHKTFKRLIHIDAYRIEHLEEAEILDLNTLLSEKDNLVVVEWANNIDTLLPKHYLEVALKEKDNKREMSITLK